MFSHQVEQNRLLSQRSINVATPSSGIFYCHALTTRNTSLAPFTVPDTIRAKVMQYELSTEELLLPYANSTTKRVLTELLSCDIIRTDTTMRRWVQTHLMETEKSLRSARRGQIRSCLK